VPDQVPSPAASATTEPAAAVPVTAAHDEAAGTQQHHHHAQGVFNFEELRGSHNLSYPAIEWFHGHPVLILNLPLYAKANFHHIKELPDFDSAIADPESVEWATQTAAGATYHGPPAGELAKAMVVARNEALVGTMPRQLSFFDQQTFWSSIALSLTALVLLVFARRSPTQYRPANRVQSILEALVLFVRDEIVRPNIKSHPDAWTPFFGSLFLALLACNLFGLIPLFASATGNIFVTGAFALSIMILMFVMGIKENGPIAFWVKLVPVHWSWNPLMIVLWLFLFVMEIAQLFIRPVVLALRLFANLFAGHTVLLVFASLGFVIHATNPDSHLLTVSLGAFGWLMTVCLYALELLVAVLQAYVFVLLSAVFIGLCAHPEH
jgi:F-type H+-transporting ATPase subunit a